MLNWLNWMSEIYPDPDDMPELPFIFPVEVAMMSQLEFEIHSIRRYLGQLEIKYYNLTGDVT